MSGLTLRHYNVTLAYRTKNLERHLRALKLHFRLRVSPRKFRSYFRALLPVTMATA